MTLSLRPHRSPSPAGFTLLEIVIAMGVLAMLLSGIFSIAKSTMELSTDLADGQERHMVRQNFIDFLRRSFRNLPGEAEIRLAVRSGGGTYLPSITVINGGTCFSPGDPLAPDTAVELAAEKLPGGSLRILLRLLDAEQTAQLRAGQPVSTRRDQPALPLIDGAGQFEWKFFDPGGQRWENAWQSPNRPLLAELLFRLDDGVEQRAVFWIPPVQRSTLMAAPASPAQPAPTGPR
ncbi:MAG: prepilin-type N-terminal cleavage/methylation domain-containing protein [Verrucomicrobiales bacterium]|nr:prepilin-type N-terminal cleavage/methylation domain-containing protein [Verrucomicrobiales bacterium]